MELTTARPMPQREAKLTEIVKRFLPFASLLVLCVVIAALEPKFLSSGNLAGVARQTAVIMIMAMGMTVVMVAGGIDLSVGSMMALAGVVGAFAMVAGASSCNWSTDLYSDGSGLRATEWRRYHHPEDPTLHCYPRRNGYLPRHRFADY